MDKESGRSSEQAGGNSTRKGEGVTSACSSMGSGSNILAWMGDGGEGEGMGNESDGSCEWEDGGKGHEGDENMLCGDNERADEWADRRGGAEAEREGSGRGDMSSGVGMKAGETTDSTEAGRNGEGAGNEVLQAWEPCCVLVREPRSTCDRRSPSPGSMKF